MLAIFHHDIASDQGCGITLTLNDEATTAMGEVVQLEPFFRLQKVQARIEEVELVRSFNAVYYDAFGPAYQPELWTSDLFARMYDVLLPGGVLVTYCAKGQVKRDLREAGFLVESPPGPPGKREMTRARKV